MDLYRKTNDLLLDWASKTQTQKYLTPFPIAVFGTLRTIPQDQGNAVRMFRNAEPIAHRKGFIPHFSSSGISLHFKENASGIVEVFFYKPEDFPSVIEDVDILESFDYESPQDSFYYVRTLMNVTILEDDPIIDEAFNAGIRWNDRDLGLDLTVERPTVPAWVYSNYRANSASGLLGDRSPIVW